jgi:adenylate cyclase
MSFFQELKRRNVVRVGIAYLVIGWVLAQVAEFAFENFGAPSWILKTFVTLLLLGFPVAVIFAWAFELTPEGIKLERDVVREESITSHTGRGIDFLIIGVLVIAVGLLVYERMAGTKPAAVEASAAQTIAVLPFVNMSDDSDHFADGLTEELLNLLAKNGELKVAGRTSSFAFKGQNDDLRGIGEALGVAKVLEGSVRRSGDRLRVTAQLINVEDGFHIWSETYDRTLADIFDIQDEVATAITQALEIHLTPSAKRLTTNPDAYALYLEALSLANLEHEEDIPKGISLLQRATRLDPNFAKAYELLAMFHWMSGGWMVEAAVGQKNVYAAATKALAIDPTLAAAASFAETSRPEGWSWIGELGALAKLVAVDRSVRPLDTYGYDLNASGYFGDAEEIYREILDLDPLSGNAWWRLGDALSAQGKDKAALEAWQKAADLGNMEGGYRLALTHILAGRDDLATPFVDVLIKDQAPGVYPDGKTFLSAMRDEKTGEASLDLWVQAVTDNAQYIISNNIAHTYYLVFGHMDKFLDAVHKANPPGLQWTNGEDMELGALILRKSGYAATAYYHERVKETGLTDLWDHRGPPDHCTKQNGEWVCR